MEPGRLPKRRFLGRLGALAGVAALPGLSTAPMTDGAQRASGRRDGYGQVVVGFKPLVGANPRLAILGTLPGPDALAAGKYYANMARAVRLQPGVRFCFRFRRYGSQARRSIRLAATRAMMTP
jgi:hypothetical protein